MRRLASPGPTGVFLYYVCHGRYLQRGLVGVVAVQDERVIVIAVGTMVAGVKVHRPLGGFSWMQFRSRDLGCQAASGRRHALDAQHASACVDDVYGSRHNALAHDHVPKVELLVR